MNCPNCNIPLQMTQREWIEIDYCPTCRWIWLDKWEIDQLIQREAKYHSWANNCWNSNISYQKQDNSYHERQNSENKNYDKYWHNNSNYHKKKESFLSDLFDF